MGSEDEDRSKPFITPGWTLSAKPCDSCRSSSALLFCRADSAFLCSACDAKVHGANKLASRHERVWMCEVCEQAPASVTCKADAAALCVTCDRDIHSANPLARRHERFPVVPFYDSPAVKSSAVSLLVPDGLDDDDENAPPDHNPPAAAADTCGEEAEAASWLLCSANPKLMDGPDLKSGDYFFSDVDPYLDLDYASSMDGRFHQQSGPAADSVVPVQSKPFASQILHPSSNNGHDLDFCRSKTSYSFNTQSLSQSSSSMDVGVVPDGTDITNPFGVSMKSGTDISNGSGNSAAAGQLAGLDREARVLRYREKRKNRKFEKTIRYASRKAYAETRPRIKGRFAKRTEIEAEVDRIYSSATVLMADTGYGVVPTF